MFLRFGIIAAAIALSASAASAGPPAPGTLVADTEFTTATGQHMNFGQLRGEVVVVTYWASDCRACEDQIKTLDYYYRQRKDLGLRVLAVSVDPMSGGQLRRAFEGKMVHPLMQIGEPFELLSGLPTTYVIDRAGQIRYAETGSIDLDGLNRILVPLIRQPQPQPKS